MKRRTFITGFLGLLTTKVWATNSFLKFFQGDSKMKVILHKANSRGGADHGWLKSQHSFSFASYYNPEKMGFGLLRVLNDDQIAPGTGFGTHPHQDMEIVSIPLSGGLKHKDSEGNETIIKDGEVQLMSAGTGVQHSEYNSSESEDTNFLQIWVMPENKGIKPRYDQKVFPIADRQDKWQLVVSPMDTDEAGVKINQQAYFSLIDLNQDKSVDYQIRSTKNGVYFFLINGELDIEGNQLETRDALGVEDFKSLSIKAKTASRLLAIEVPMA